MRPWDLETSAAQLRRATEDLQLAWLTTQDHWHDSVSKGFCETHLEPLGPAVKQTLDEASRMQQLLNQMQREVDDERRSIL